MDLNEISCKQTGITSKAPPVAVQRFCEVRALISFLVFWAGIQYKCMRGPSETEITFEFEFAFEDLSIIKRSFTKAHVVILTLAGG